MGSDVGVGGTWVVDEDEEKAKEGCCRWRGKVGTATGGSFGLASGCCSKNTGSVNWTSSISHSLERAKSGKWLEDSEWCETKDRRNSGVGSEAERQEKSMQLTGVAEQSVGSVDSLSERQGYGVVVRILF